jgi:uncharacterized membrane protein YtjA (UPF0391 family)
MRAPGQATLDGGRKFATKRILARPPTPARELELLAGHHRAAGLRRRANHQARNQIMLRWAVVFLIIALIAGFLGFQALDGLAMQIAKILFVIFLILFVVSLITGRRVRLD